MLVEQKKLRIDHFGIRLLDLGPPRVFGSQDDLITRIESGIDHGTQDRETIRVERRAVVDDDKP